MLKKIIAIVFVAAPSLWANEGTYLTRYGSAITIGNRYIGRIISVSPDHAGTTEIVNKLSGMTYKVSDDVFGLQVVFSGLGPAPKENQNGENDAVLTAKDFQFTGYNQSDLSGDGKELTLNFAFNWDETAFRVQVHYAVYPEEFSFRKWLQVADSSYGIQFLDRIYIESMSINPADFSHGQFGQPVFDNDIFMGVEYPTVENIIDGRHVMIGYVLGQDIARDPYETHEAILGASVSDVKLEQTFMTYVRSIEVAPPHPYLLYNSWYDLRNPSISNGDAGIMNEVNTLKTIDLFKMHLYDRYGIALSGFVLDDGWDNYNSLWAIDSSRFPHGFTPLVTALDSMQTSLGLWASPLGGYSNRDIRARWAKHHGYETTGDYLSLAGTKYDAYFRNIMDDYTEKYHVGYFKWDGLLLASNDFNHGHLPGIYSREEELNDYIDVMKSVRKINPDIFLNITSGTWLSPWWLKYANCIWMQGEDYGYQESVPSINERDKAILYKDAVLWDDFRKSHLLFPISGLMTHGIIQGRYNLLGGADESLSSFTDEVMMYFGRGVMMWELYISPDLLSPGEWDAIASSMKWAKSNENILQSTKMVLGNPNAKQVYGYIHLTNNKGILLLRNPYVTKQNVNLKLTPDLGEIDPARKYFVRVIYPYDFIFPRPVKMNETLTFSLDGYEVLIAELIPGNEMDKNYPTAVKFSIQDGTLTVYGLPGQVKKIRTVGGKNFGVVRFGNSSQEAEFKLESQSDSPGPGYSGHLSITVPADYKDARLALLLETDAKLENGQQPSFSVEVNGVTKKPEVVKGDGTWFWIVSDLDHGKNSVYCSVKLKANGKGKVSLWMIGEKELVGHVLNGITAGSKEVLPAEPYPAIFQKQMVPISHYEIQ